MSDTKQGEARMSVRSCEGRHGWEVRIRLPDYDVDQPSKDITAGSWQSTEDGHGLFVSVDDPKDLLAIARLLEAAAAACAKKDEATRALPS